MSNYPTLAKWDFHQRDDRDGWIIPTALNDQVAGGCLWITPAGEP